MIRGGALNLDTMVGDSRRDEDVVNWLSQNVYRRIRPRGLIRWVRHGIVPSITRPGIGFVFGSPGLYSTDALVGWVEKSLGDLADTWPDRPTVIVAYDLATRKRVPFGTDDAPDVPLKYAVAASSAVPFVYEPVTIDGRAYADGGVASGTSADLLLANPEPLDLVAQPPVEGQTVTLRSLADAPWISGPEGSTLADAIESTCRTVGGFTPNVVHRVSDAAVTIALADRGLGVGLLPRLATRGAPQHLIHPAPGTVTRSIMAVCLPESLSHPPVSRFWNALDPPA
jgi:predicted acylesterase/phospholipase RssA